MCLSCGCHMPNNDHHDERHITLADLMASAKAAGITAEQAACNITDTLCDVMAQEPEE